VPPFNIIVGVHCSVENSPGSSGENTIIDPLALLGKEVTDGGW